MTFTEEQVKEIRVEVRRELRMILDKGLMYSDEAKLPPMPNADVLSNFPPELRTFLTLKEGCIHAQFVERGLWGKMDEIARSLGFKWVSQGKNSRWTKQS